jgi:hypothetical protein
VADIHFKNQVGRRINAQIELAFTGHALGIVRHPEALIRLNTALLESAPQGGRSSMFYGQIELFREAINHQKVKSIIVVVFARMVT